MGVLLKAALAKNEVVYHHLPVALPLDGRLLDWARATRRGWQGLALPPGVRFCNVFGVGKDTPQAVEYGTASAPIVELPDVIKAAARFDLVDGDGDVPAESACGDGFGSAAVRVAMKGEHKGLLEDKKLRMLLQKWLGIDEAVAGAAAAAVDDGDVESESIPDRCGPR